jgi:tagatose-6-phosphate ketose/aldose isomerase
VIKFARETTLLTFEDLLSLSDPEKLRLGVEHTPREISQQPATWLETFDTIRNRQAEIRQFLAASVPSGSDNNRLCVSLIGAGTSDYIGRAIEGLLGKEWNCRVRAVPSTDLMTEMDELIFSARGETQHLWISFSRSGDSFEGVKVLERALEKYPLIRHLIITCNASGRMAAEVAPGRSNVLCIELADRVNDRGLAMTSSFTNMVVAGQCLAHITDLDRYKPIVQALSAAANHAMSAAASLAQAIAAIGHTRICFLGSGPLRAAGDESALKVMELTAGSYSVMSESFLGLRHGPLSWLDENSLVVGFLSNNAEKRRIEIGLLDELKAKSVVRDIIVVAPQSSIVVASADNVLRYDLPESLHDAYRPPLDVMFAQCLGLFASLARHLKPDSPSADGKIRRVVSEINVAA